MESEECIKYLNFTVALEEKETDHEKHKELAWERIKQAGKNFSNYVERVYFPKNQVTQFLKSGLHNVKVQRVENVSYLNDLNKKVLFDSLL